MKTYFTVSNNVKTDNLDTTVPMGTSWANIPIPIEQTQTQMGTEDSVIKIGGLDYRYIKILAYMKKWCYSGTIILQLKILL
ncbi:MAG: hypothetical protein IPM86_00870 [Saprospiraceae bacterium]|nr:hypothetical protein [Saprospiraceae bacterium]